MLVAMNTSPSPQLTRAAQKGTPGTFRHSLLQTPSWAEQGRERGRLSVLPPSYLPALKSEVALLSGPSVLSNSLPSPFTHTYALHRLHSRCQLFHNQLFLKTSHTA